jgi:hypothetical protein
MDETRNLTLGDETALIFFEWSMKNKVKKILKKS